jgi:hypothetical protein
VLSVEAQVERRLQQRAPHARVEHEIAKADAATQQ